VVILSGKMTAALKLLAPQLKSKGVKATSFNHTNHESATLNWCLCTLNKAVDCTL